MALQTPSMQELLEAGVHFGHQVRRGNPRMKPYIYGVRDGVHIIDLAKSEEMLREAIEEAYRQGKEGKVMLIVGTKKQAREIVESLAKEVSTPYIAAHWIGGLLTNFDEIRRNFKKLNDLKVAKEKGELSHFTKKEQLLIDRKLDKYRTEFGGVAEMDKMPDVLFLIDSAAEITAVKEAQRMNIPMIGFSDTNSDPGWLDFPFAANDDGIKSIKICAEAVVRAYGEGKKVAGKAAIAAAEKAEAAAKKEQLEKEKADAILDAPVAEQAEAIEEEVEKKTVEASSRKVE